MPILRLSSAVLFCLPLLAPAASAEAPPAPGPEQIARWIMELGNEEFAVREAASRHLWEAGETAEKALQQAAQSDDAEVVRRARLLLDKLKWGIYPDTPPRVVEIIHRFQAARPEQRPALVNELLGAGWPGCRAVLKIAMSAEDPATRAAVSTVLTSRVSRVAPYLLKEGRPESLELLVAAARKVDDQHGPRHYAAYWLLRGGLEDRIRLHQEAAAKSKDKKEYLTLAYLHRARGDLVAARQAAELDGQSHLVEALLYEAGDWKELVRLGAPAVAAQPIEKLGLRAAYQRLGGAEKAFQATLTDLHEQAGGDGPNEMRTYQVAKALFLNDRPAEALALLGTGTQHRLERFEILCAQTKFPEAIHEAEQFLQQHPLPALDLARARTLYILGEKDKAMVIFDRYAAQIKEGTDASWFGNLIEAEYRLGLHDRALDHLARVLAVSKDTGWTMRIFPLFFPGQSDVAEVWWGILLPQYTGKQAEALRRLRGLLTGTLPAREVTQQIEAALRHSTEYPDRHYLALAEAAVAPGLETLAVRCWDQLPAHPTSLLRRGDLLAAKAKWEDAASLYRRAWEAAAEQPLPLYLAGQALIRAGKEEAGRKLIEQAHLLPLGEEDIRLDFAEALSRRGEHDAARHEYELVMRLAEPGGFLTGEALRQAAFAAAAHQDWATAAAGQEKAMLRCLRATVNFQYASAYVSLPALVHRLRARAALAANHLEEARWEIALGQAAQPGSIETALALVPQLQRQGHTKEATELFEHTLAPWEKICEAYPRCAEAHNSAAWLSVRCRRNLDAALAHALTAVEQEPGTASFHDTLAEIYFQRGAKDKALAAQRKAIELNPKREYFRQQLRRIEAGDPNAELPTDG